MAAIAPIRPVVFLNSIYFSEKNSYGSDRPVVFLNSIYFSEKNLMAAIGHR
jgi:hypothetical protein